MRILSLISPLLLFPILLQAQIEIDTLGNASRLIEQYLLSPSSGIVANEVKLKGAPHSVGIFQNRDNNLIPTTGLILSTGNVFDARGPNDETNASGSGRPIKDTDLAQLVQQPLFDATVLEFDLIPLSDSLKFQYFFASEEYPEYVNKGVNDVFGFFLSQADEVGSINLAQLTDGTPIAVDNINHLKNNDHYVSNVAWKNVNLDFLDNNRNAAELSAMLQFDGMTKLLTAKCAVEAGKIYHLKLAIADVGDRAFDSAVFLKAKSLFADGEEWDLEVLKKVLENLQDDQTISIVEEGGQIRLEQSIYFDTDASRIREESVPILKKLVSLLKASARIQMQIIGHTDNQAAADYNQQLSERRARVVRRYLQSSGIKADRLEDSGKGETQPIAPNSNEEGRQLNRRVSFVFSSVP